MCYEGRKEGNVLFNDALNTFNLRLYGVRHMVKDHSETRCRHMGYSFRLTARVLLYAPSHRQDSTYHGLCCTSCWSTGRNEKYINGSTMKDRSYDPSHRERMLITELHLAPCVMMYVLNTDTDFNTRK